jgi:hypothetical protein
MKKFIVVNLKASVSSVTGKTMLNTTGWPNLKPQPGAPPLSVRTVLLEYKNYLIFGKDPYRFLVSKIFKL